jgi:hypothetical protein
LADAFGVLERAGGAINLLSAAFIGFTAALQSGQLDAVIGLINLALDGMGLAMAGVMAGMELVASAALALAGALAAIPTPLLALGIAAATARTAWTLLATAASALGAALTTLVLGTVSRAILLFGQLTAAAGVLTAAVRALWVALAANPLGAVVLALGAAATAFQLYRNATAETVASLGEFRTATAAQANEIESLRAKMAAAVPGSQAYNEAGRRLAELVPGLNLSLSAQGQLIAEVGAGFEENGRKLSAYVAELDRLEQAALSQQLMLTAEALRDADAAVDSHVQRMRLLFGANSEQRDILQQLNVALFGAAGGLDKMNVKGGELAATQRTASEAFRQFALQALDSAGSIDGVAEALREAGASGADIRLVVGYL